MGIIRQGIFGGFENRTGGLVGRRLNGKNVISAPPHQTDKLMTQAQIDQQLKFGLVIQFLKRMTYLIKVGFKQGTGKGNAFNRAVKYNFGNIITGTSPDYSIDYTKLVFSRGSLAGPNAPAIHLELNAVKVSWLPDAQTRFNQHRDRASFLVYCPGKNVIVTLTSSTERSALGYNIAVPQDFEGDEMYVFMAFVSADGKVVSDSVYLGLV
ncbi:hypothetical protein HDC92_004561 [Pedobacter sp. AK017]|nr:hypothetical protein [Pedobacter sp. AK017]